MRGPQFTKLQQFYLSIRIVLPQYKNCFIGRSNDFFKVKHDKVNNTPFYLELQNLGTTGEIWGNYLHLDTPNDTVRGVHIVQHYDEEDNYCPLHSLTS